MPYAVKWLIPDRVMLAVHYGVMNGEETLAYITESMAMRDAANERAEAGAALVHTITDARALQRSEIGLKDVQAVLKSLKAQKVGWSVYVSPGAFERFIVSVAHQMVGVRHYICPTMDDAVKFLKENAESQLAITVADIDALSQSVIGAPVKP